MLARAAPFGVLLAALLFAAAEAFGFRLQGVGLPSQLAQATPYVLTLIALIVGQRAQPARPPPGAGRTAPRRDRPPVADAAASSHVSLE